MPSLIRFLRRNYSTLRDVELLKVLQSELKYEQSTNPFQRNQSGSLADFVLDWDSPPSQDVVLRKKCESGEEIAISALLGPETYGGNDWLQRQVLMKVCIKKLGLSPVLQFDCAASSKGDDGSEFAICNACYLQPLRCFGASEYKGPSFSSLDPKLQDAFKEYLLARGIGKDLTNFLLLHLHKKEQGQYVDWLQKLEAMVSKRCLTQTAAKRQFPYIDKKGFFHSFSHIPISSTSKEGILYVKLSLN